MQKKEACNAKRLMITYLSLPTECHDYQFAQRAHFSTPASSSQPVKKQMLINDRRLENKILYKPFKIIQTDDFSAYIMSKNPPKIMVESQQGLLGPESLHEVMRFGPV